MIEKLRGKIEKEREKAEKEELAKINFDCRLQKEKEEKEQLKKKLRELEETEERCMETLKKTLRIKDVQMTKLERYKSKKGFLKNSVDFDGEKKIKQFNTQFNTDKKIGARTKSIMTPEQKLKNLHKQQWK